MAGSPSNGRWPPGVGEVRRRVSTCCYSERPVFVRILALFPFSFLSQAVLYKPVPGFPCLSVRVCINALDLREAPSRLGLHNNALDLRETPSRLGLHNNALNLRETPSRLHPHECPLLLGRTNAPLICLCLLSYTLI